MSSYWNSRRPICWRWPSYEPKKAIKFSDRQLTLVMLFCIGSIAAYYAWAQAVATFGPKLTVHITTAPGLLSDTVESGRVLLLLGKTKDDLRNTDVRHTTTQFFGKNVYSFYGQDLVLTGGSADNIEIGVFGWPIRALDEIPQGVYFVQAFLNIYNETVIRSDGSMVTIRFPCGDGNPAFGGSGSLSTNIRKFEIRRGMTQTISLQFQTTVEPIPFDGMEIGGCSQGNYKDTELLKYVKIRSDSLSSFWNRDMYIGAKVLLPAGYNASDTRTRYPVVYSQFHWLGGESWWSHDAAFTEAWHSGTIPAQDGKPARPTPKVIVVMFRHENPFYDDSYAVNSPNLGPYGDALNDELVPHLDMMFSTIAQPYARIQEGGSTGGWAAAASVIFRPDLYGACFASYPDSLDFHRHQDNNLYEQAEAHVRNGLPVPSNRKVDDDGVERVKVTMEEENHWELTFGTSGRSALQTDVWFAVFGVQGLNGYPLAAWDKITGEIYPDVVELWKPMDLTHHILSNWDSKLNLGEVLRERIHIYVGGMDSYYLNEGVEQFRMRVTEKGGPEWANVTVFPGEAHGGVYNLLPKWIYLDLLLQWIADHAPEGKTPLSDEYTRGASRGNLWDNVLAFGGRQAALTRQSPPHIDMYPSHQSDGRLHAEPQASVGRWDPGVALKAQWLVDGKGDSDNVFDVKQRETLTFSGHAPGRTLQLVITGTKDDYIEETRRSNIITLG